MGLLYLFITVALITCQGGAEEMTPRGPRPNMPGAQSKQQCSPRDYDFCTDDVKGKVCPSGCRLAWLMRDGEQRIGSQLNSLVTRVNAIVNRGKTLVVNFRQAHNQANTILSESNVVDESHGKMLNRLEQYVLHIQNRIDIQLKRLQQLRAVLLAQLQNILRLEIDIDMALRTCKGACTKTVMYHLDKDMSERLEKAAALLARADLYAVERLIGTERTSVTSTHTGSTRTDTHHTSGSASSTGTHPSMGSTGTHSSMGSTGTFFSSTGTGGTHPSMGSTGTLPSMGSTGTHPSMGSTGTFYSSTGTDGTHPSMGSTGTFPSMGSTGTFFSSTGTGGTHPSMGSTGTLPSMGSTGTLPSMGSTGTHPSMGSTGTHSSMGSTGTFFSSTGTGGTHPSMGSTGTGGTHPSMGSTGTHPSMGSTETHPSMGSTGTGGTHPSMGSTGTHPSMGSTGTHPSMGSTGTHPSMGSTGTFFSSTGTGGTHPSMGSTGTHPSMGSTGTGGTHPSGGLGYFTPGLGRTDTGTRPVGGVAHDIEVGSHDSTGGLSSTTTEHHTTIRHPTESHSTFSYHTSSHGSDSGLDLNYPEDNFRQGFGVQTPAPHLSHPNTGGTGSGSKDTKILDSAQTSHTSHSSSYTSSTGEGERDLTFPGLDLPKFDSLPAFEQSGSRSSSGGLSSSSTFTSSSGSSPVVLSASTLDTEKMPSQPSSGSHSFSSSTSTSSHSTDLPFGTDRTRVFDDFGISASMRDIMSRMTTDQGLRGPSFSDGADSMRGEMASTTSHHSKTVTKRVWVETLSNGTKVTRTEITHSEGGPAEVTLSSVGGADGKTTLQHEVRGLRKRRSKKTSKHH